MQKTQCGYMSSDGEVARPNHSTMARRDANTRMSDPLARVPNYRTLVAERQGVQEERNLLRATIESRSNTRRNPIFQGVEGHRVYFLEQENNVNELAWLDTSQVALETLLIPRPCLARLSIQAPDVRLSSLTNKCQELLCTD